MVGSGKLINKGTLSILDITGHTIGDDEIKLITQFVQSGAKGIAFGRTNATLADILIYFK